LSGQRRANARYLFVFQRALRLSAPHPQFIEVRDEILGLYAQFFSQQMDSGLSHLSLPVLFTKLLKQSLPRTSADLHAQCPIEALSPQKPPPARRIAVEVTAAAAPRPVDPELLIGRR
jgi:hypothetical protein